MNPDPLQPLKDRSTHPGMVEDIPGWRNLVLTLDAAIATLVPNYRIEQVKEKFGGLRYYIGVVSPDFYDRVHTLIRVAEAESYHICDVCGEPGSLRNDRPWNRTLCDDHGTEES